MGTFDFLADVPNEPYTKHGILRLNRRHGLLIAPYADDFKGARVLDLGAHDGRWAYALAEAGAREVIGIEARQHLIDRFADYPETAGKQRVDLRRGDFFDVLEDMVRADERFDIVVLYGIFYHIIEHFRLLKLIQSLGPKAIFVDSEFSTRRMALIEMRRERTAQKVNAAPQVPGQDRAVVGFPTARAMEFMGEALGYTTHWIDAQAVFDGDPTAVKDYFQDGGTQRRFCILVPEDAD
ncbi:MAG: methyltransferase domain-containing protein [Pseudomonadota bacterium]